MTFDLYRILQFLVFTPLYLTAFVGIALVLRLRRTHPRACWFAVAGGAVLFLNWGVTAAMGMVTDQVRDWASRTGFSHLYVWLAFDAVLAVLQTTAAGLLIAAIVVGRRQEP